MATPPPAQRRCRPPRLPLRRARGTRRRAAGDATVAVIGAGAMGAGIAQIAALAGHRVQLHDARFGAADAAKKAHAATLRQARRQGPSSTRAEADAALARIATVVHARRRLRRGARDRGDRRGPRRQARAVRAARERRRADAHPRVEHLVAVDHRARRRADAPRARRRHALLQSGAADAAGRGRVAASRPTRRWPTRIVATARAWGKTPVHAASTPGLHRQPLRAAVLRRGAAAARRARRRRRRRSTR